MIIKHKLTNLIFIWVRSHQAGCKAYVLIVEHY